MKPSGLLWKTRLLVARWSYRQRAALPKIRLGTPYGGWTIAPTLLNQNSVCYCFGAGEDISFDVQLASRFGAQVVVFDPTPRAQAHFQTAGRVIRREIECPFREKLCGEYNVDPGVLSRITFEPVGVWHEDTVLKFYAPRDPSAVSHSVLNLQRTSDFFEANVRCLRTLMAQFRHESLALVKLDIEGAEYKVLEYICRENIPIQTLCVEFDEYYNPLDGFWFQRVRDAIGRVLHNGYQLLHIDKHFNVTFVSQGSA